MDKYLSDILLSRFSEFVADKIGLNFPKERWNDLERGVAAAAREFDFKDAESCIRRLISSPLSRDQIEILASHLTVGETYFFRDKRGFEILERDIIPDLICQGREKERRIRIWSAGCCTGEEPYSIAILLHKIIPDLKEWNITIIATDINPFFLKKAQDGIYGEWSFRDTTFWIKDRYFKKKKDGRFEIFPEIKKMVNFSYLNLAEDVYPSLLNNTNAMDLIFCRNVLIYFTHERAKRVVQNLHRSLTDGGWLFVSPSETSHLLFSRFNTINFQDAIIYRKTYGSEFRVPSFEFEFQTTEPIPDIALLQPARQIEVVKQKKIEPELNPYTEAKTFYEQGSYEAAINKIMGLIRDGQADSKAISLLSRAYANQGKLSEALAWCEKAIASDRLNPGLYYHRAMIFLEQGATDEAIISLKKALYLDQDLILAHFALGNLAARQGRLKESKRHFRNALDLLQDYQKDKAVPESDGISAGRLSEIIIQMMPKEMVA